MLNPFQEGVPEPPEPPFEVAFVNPGFQDSKPLAAYPGKYDLGGIRMARVSRC